MKKTTVSIRLRLCSVQSDWFLMSVIFPQSDVLMPFSVLMTVSVVPYCRRMSRRWEEVAGVGGGGVSMLSSWCDDVGGRSNVGSQCS